MGGKPMAKQVKTSLNVNSTLKHTAWKHVRIVILNVHPRSIHTSTYVCTYEQCNVKIPMLNHRKISTICRNNNTIEGKFDFYFIFFFLIFNFKYVKWGLCGESPFCRRILTNYIFNFLWKGLYNSATLAVLVAYTVA